MKKLKKIPNFRTEAEEDAFWQKADSSAYLDYSKFQLTRFPNLKLSTKPITIRLPGGLLDRIKLEANKRDIAYQSLIKQILYKGLQDKII